MTQLGSARPWHILFGLALGVIVSNSFGRIAYGLILPAMKESLDWNYTQAGWLNTANSLGYVAGSILLLILVRYFAPFRIFIFGTAATAIFLFATGFEEGLTYQTVCRTAVGLFGALSFVSGGVLAAGLFPKSPGKSALAIALYFGGGGGMGIAFCGAVLPAMLDLLGPQSWDWAWYGVGTIALLICPISIWAALRLNAIRHEAASPTFPAVGKMFGELGGYGFFGLGYIAYVTFISVWMAEQKASVFLTAGTWMVLGFSVMASPFVWRGILSKSSSGRPLAMILLGLAIGSALPILLSNAYGLIVSALVFGLTTFMPPTAVTNFVRKNLPEKDWGSTISFFTIVFAIAQTLGPIGAGVIGDWTGEIGDSLIVASIVLLVGAAFAASQRPLKQKGQPT